MPDSTEISGKAIKPNMMDKTVSFISENSEKILLKSDDIQSITFYLDGTTIKYERVLTYRNYSNKYFNKNKSWLEVKNSGYVTLYYGYQPGINSPNLNLWYCKSQDETVAYFISMKYSGGLVLTIGTESDFVKNASFYFNDYPELANKIITKELNFNDLSTIVDIYNNWKENN